MVSDNLFLVCGLCSQVVDESMTIDDPSLRSFLIHMLSISNDDLPAKVCTDCFQGITECKKFADRCGRAIAKLKNTRLSDHMILGRTARDKKQIKSMEAEVEAANPVQNLDVSDFDSKKHLPPPKKAARPGPASRKGPRAPEVSTDLILDSPSGRRATRGAVIPDDPPKKASRTSSGAYQNGHVESAAGPRTSRKSGGFEWERYPVSKSQYRSLTKRRNQPKAVIAQVERSLADQAYFSDTMSIDYRKRRQLATPTKTPARKGAPPAGRSRSAGPASRKRRGGMFDDADEDEDPLAVPVPKKSRRSLGNDDPPARSSFGRARKMKKGYSEATDPFGAADEEDPLDVTPPRQRSPPVPKPKSKPQSAKAKAATPGGKSKKEPDYYYVDGSGKRSKPGDFDDVGSDEGEIFPSIGPYQCEICQEITHTKQEFVEHIKNNHRKVVDEEVLRSLEHDLKISKKKEMKARLDVVRAAKEKKLERQQEAAKIRAKEKKKLNVVTPPQMNKGPNKGKRGRPPKAAFAQSSAVPVAKKSVAPPPPAPLGGPNNMEVFPSIASEEGQPAAAAANPEKTFARKYEHQMSNEFLAADSTANTHITSSPLHSANPLETNEAEISVAETDPFVSTEPMSSPPPVVTSAVSSSFDFIQPAAVDGDALPPPHAPAAHAQQVQPDYALENAAVVTSYDDQSASTATLTPLGVMPPPPASYEMPEPLADGAAAAGPSGMGMAMQTAALQPYAVDQQPPQVLISGVETTVTPQDGLPFF